MKTSTEILNRAIKSAQANVVQARNNVQTIKGNRRLLGRILNTLAKALGDQKHYMFVSSCGDIHLNMDDLPGFKCMELEMVLNALENIGEVQRTKEYATYLNRDYTYKVDGIEVYLTVYIKSDSETCKRVAVGTKVSEEIIYEIQCS